MKRVILTSLKVPALAATLLAAGTVAEPMTGPGVRAMTLSTEDCYRKAVYVGGEMHCHETGTNCRITCPEDS